MSDDKKLREAAEWYTDEGRHFAWNEHARTLAEWAVAELSRRDAEAAERAKLLPLGDLVLCETDQHRLEHHIHGVGRTSLILVDRTLDDEVVFLDPTIGQRDDLITALKGGTK